jgi:hypothetical protein
MFTTRIVCKHHSSVYLFLIRQLIGQNITYVINNPGSLCMFVVYEELHILYVFANIIRQRFGVKSRRKEDNRKTES